MHILPVILLLLVMPISCATTNQTSRTEGLKPLSATELRAVLSDATANVTLPNGASFTSYLTPEGAIRGVNRTSTFTGTWEVTDDGKTCYEFSNQPGGKQCTAVYKVGDEYLDYDLNGRHKATYTLTSGNIKNL